MHGFCPISSQLDPSDFSFHTKLLALSSNLFTSSSNTSGSQILNEKRDWDTRCVLPKFSLRRDLLSVEGAARDPAKVSSRGPRRPTLFLLPLVDSFPCGGGIEPLQTFHGTPQSLGCSLATPSHLGPKSPWVTNANHEIDNMHKCSRVACSQIWISLNPKYGFCKFESITH